jgi:20S proteasome subunit beta 6
MGLKAIARMIQTMLYAKRFFPYYVYNILGGIEEDGKLLVATGFGSWLAGTGAVYSYDPVGSYEREACRAAGAAQSLLQPFLDNQVGSTSSNKAWPDRQIYFRNQTTAPGAEKPIPGNLPLATVLSIATDAFTSATEREIRVGDELEMFIVMNAERTTDDLLGEGKLPTGMTVDELTPLGEGGGERTFLVKRALKRD